MHRLEPQMSRRLEALLDERDHLNVRISLEADRAEADAEKLMAMSHRLALVEDEIVAERRKLDAGP